MRNPDGDWAEIDVVVPVHTSTRPFGRTVESALANDAAIRVTIIAHGIASSEVASVLAFDPDDQRVRIVSLIDGIRSPAGPKNLGIALATAEFLAFVDSDDELERGALDAWISIARRESADLVIAPIDNAGGDPDQSPPVGRGRKSGLRGERDRLSYRSAPLGLLRRTTLGDLRFTAGLASGEDLELATRLWFSGASISFDPSAPAYVVHHDATDRATSSHRTVEEDFRFMDTFEETPWFLALRRPERRAISLKIIRVHIFDAIAARLEHGTLAVDDRVALAAMLRRIVRLSPGVRGFLSMSDARALRVALAASSTADEVHNALNARWIYGAAPTRITANPLLSAHRQAPYRTTAAAIRTRGAIEAARGARSYS